MNIWQKGTGTVFRNSAVCEGEVYVPDSGPIDMAPIKITGRYPEEGFLYNEVSHEFAYVIEGSGSIEQRDGKRPLRVGDAVYFAPNEKVAWDGNMTILTICSPQFDQAQHKIEEK